MTEKKANTKIRLMTLAGAMTALTVLPFRDAFHRRIRSYIFLRYFCLRHMQ